MHLKKWMNLRALHLARTKLESLPNDIGKLLHLRYLDLSQSDLIMLPKSITKLVNLQTLHLNGLAGLKELPRDLNRLVKLRVLGIAGCQSLKYMPDDMNRMTCLNTLSMFVVPKRDSSMKQWLEDLRDLSKLKGSLEIRINKNFVYKKKEINSRGGGYISDKKYLSHIEIKWFQDDEYESENEEGGIDNVEDLLEDLQPHMLKGWWRSDTTSGLVMEDDEMMGGESSVQTTTNYDQEERRPEGGVWKHDSGSLSRDGPKMRFVSTDNARHLKSLPPVALRCLAELRISRDSKAESLSEIEVVFRSCSSSLQSLHVYSCSCLKSVSRVLEYLTALESLTLSGQEELRFDETDGEGQGEGEEEDRASLPWRRLGQCLLSLKFCVLPKVDDLPKGMCYLTALQSLRIDDLPLKDLPEWIGCLSSLLSLEILQCKHLESLPAALRKLTSIQRLEITKCSKLRSVSGGLEYLTALELLTLSWLQELRFDETDREGGEGEERDCTSLPWRRLGQCLRSLTFCELPKVDDLPKGMCYLTSLQFLFIQRLPLKDLPEWIGCLSSLQFLKISLCKRLESLPDALRKLTSLQRLKSVTKS
ncbi:hypothetical protein Cgig2_001227 [Carnegiea gigantea]|uniref:Uncharacterized protein n=1 Tax=Carnegiea gigantea TaxID=171969 RepID=A0A9Q1K008_9CARY|nr:hypothetical protein Cgig2_001227 [Carnegiea gigantea]